MNFIFINGKIETLSFFSTALATELEKMGHTTYTHEFYDMPPLSAAIYQMILTSSLSIV